MDDVPLYNSRITDGYIQYIRQYHPEVDIAALLKDSGLTDYQLADSAHWLTQKEVNAFHQALIQHTNDTDLSHKAGQLVPLSRSSGALRRHVMGLLNIHTVYSTMARLNLHYSRSVDATSRKIDKQTLEVTFTPRPNVKEKPFQCQNRIGILEGMAVPLSHEMSKVDHPECVHEGHKSCRYIVHLPASATMPWRRISGIITMLGIVVALLFLFLSPFVAGIVASIWLIMVLTVRLKAMSEQVKRLTDVVHLQSESGRSALESLNDRYANATLVQKVGRVTATVLDPHELVTRVTQVMEELLNFDRGMVMLADKEKTRLLHIGGYGLALEFVARLREYEFRIDSPVSRGAFWEAYHYRKVVTAQTAADLMRLTPELRQFVIEAKLKSLLCVPIVYEDDCIGILAVDRGLSGMPVTQSDVNLLEGIATQLAVGLVNGETFRRLRDSERQYRELFDNAENLREISRTDGLTQVANRRHFDESLILEFERAGRCDNPLALIMVDIDFFKTVNDRHGHPIGDRTLKSVSAILRTQARKYDIVARFGGEEFAILLPQTNLKKAVAVAERIRASVEAERISLPKDEETLRVTASFGVAAWPHPDITSTDDFVCFADKALYRAKLTGRNKVVSQEMLSSERKTVRSE